MSVASLEIVNSLLYGVQYSIVGCSNFAMSIFMDNNPFSWPLIPLNWVSKPRLDLLTPVNIPLWDLLNTLNGHVSHLIV